jgi:hypothetical protein
MVLVVRMGKRYFSARILARLILKIVLSIEINIKKKKYLNT